MQTHVYHITYSPEVETAYLFFWGCNMHCRGCIRLLHGWDSHLPDPGQPKTEIQPRLLAMDEVLNVLAPHPIRRIFFLGDDPSVDPVLEPLAQALKDRFRAEHVLLTNGLLLPPYRLFDEIQVSIKAVTPELHRDFTGVDVAPALDHFRHLYEAGIRLRSESIVIPGYIDAVEIERVAKFIASVDPDIPYRLDAYIPVPGTPWRRPTRDEMTEAMAAARRHLRHVHMLHARTSQRHQVVRLV
ncbi:MAG TPA: radical SAM protein [Caldilineae bacterium]|nr:radical SAM protein [Caldilineae bacterium]